MFAFCSSILFSLSPIHPFITQRQRITASLAAVTTSFETHASQTTTTAPSASTTSMNPSKSMPNDSPNFSAGPMLSSSLQTADAFGSLLGEEIVCNWRRGFELPPNLMGMRSPMHAMHANQQQHHIPNNTDARLFNQQAQQQQHLQQQQLQQHHHLHQQQQQLQPFNSISNMKSLNPKPTDTNCQSFKLNTNSTNLDDNHGNRLDDKSSHHDHDASSTASTPILQDSRFDDNQNGGMTPMSLPISKSPQEDNNNHLGALPHPAGFPLGLPFHHQMQAERAHYRFSDELSLGGGSMAGRLGDSLIPKSDPMEAKLQEMLRYNMDKYANQNLDTLHISRRVRELLSVHNIGQRLFAKYVLGLSQGTVSELLSKPKPWDKLTEKGRDSYRKMHAWACDDNAVLLLKSLIPKKGECDSFFSHFCLFI